MAKSNTGFWENLFGRKKGTPSAPEPNPPSVTTRHRRVLHPGAYAKAVREATKELMEAPYGRRTRRRKSRLHKKRSRRVRSKHNKTRRPNHKSKSRTQRRRRHRR